MAMKVKRKIIEIDEALCDGCGQCVPSCAEGAIEVINEKARIVAEEYCDGLGACLGECPNGALQIVEREVEDFDEEAVEAHLKNRKDAQKAHETIPPLACPSAQLQNFAGKGSNPFTEGTTEGNGPESGLSHWPVQINLVPPTAPFLKGANLLVAADCVPVAYGNFHQDFLKGKVVMLGCPKFDEVQGYIQKFTDIFKAAGIRSVTAVVMEVPCCSGLPMIVKKAMEAAGKKIPMEEVTVSVRGQLLKREKHAA
jgi:Fe-S-cluster-containing hydrogenase component 2